MNGVHVFAFLHQPRMLKVATKIDNMAKATTEAAEVTEKAKKKRRSGGTEKDKPRDLGF